MEEQEKNKRMSFRIQFDPSDVEFMNEFKAEYGTSTQWFVEKAVKTAIQEIKIKQQLEEL